MASILSVFTKHKSIPKDQIKPGMNEVNTQSEALDKFSKILSRFTLLLLNTTNVALDATNMAVLSSGVVIVLSLHLLNKACSEAKTQINQCNNDDTHTDVNRCIRDVVQNHNVLIIKAKEDLIKSILELAKAMGSSIDELLTTLGCTKLVFYWYFSCYFTDDESLKNYFKRKQQILIQLGLDLNIQLLREKALIQENTQTIFQSVDFEETKNHALKYLTTTHSENSYMRIFGEHEARLNELLEGLKQMSEEKFKKDLTRKPNKQQLLVTSTEVSLNTLCNSEITGSIPEIKATIGLANQEIEKVTVENQMNHEKKSLQIENEKVIIEGLKKSSGMINSQRILPLTNEKTVLESIERPAMAAGGSLKLNKR